MKKLEYLDIIFTRSCGKFESEKTAPALAVTVFKYNFYILKAASVE